jgi:hypothetical protein
MANDSDRLLQPWFQPREIAYELKRRMTITEQRKFVLYFEKWGCIVCSPNARGHGALGTPPVYIDEEKVEALQKQGLSLPKIAKELGVGYDTLWRFSKGIFHGKKPFKRPEAPENGREAPQHRSLGLCGTCHRRVVSRMESILRENAPEPGRIEPTFMDSVRLAREAVAPSMAMLQAEAAKGRRDK